MVRRTQHTEARRRLVFMHGEPEIRRTGQNDFFLNKSRKLNQI